MALQLEERAISFDPTEGQMRTERIETGRLKVDVPGYQRDVSANALHEMRTRGHGWNERAAGNLTVVERRTGTLLVVDGHHRVELAKLEGIPDVRCNVWSGLTKKDEAELFLQVNAARTHVSPQVRFKAAVTAGDVAAVAIKNAVEAAGFSVATSHGKSRNALRTIGAFETIFRRAGADELAYTLEFIRQTWGDTDEGFHPAIILGLNRLLLKGGEQIDREEAAEKFRSLYPEQIIAKAKHLQKSMAQSLEKMAASVLLDEYTKREPKRRVRVDVTGKLQPPPVPRGAKRQPLPDEVIEEIRQEHKEGMAKRMIAERHNMPFSTVWGILAEA